MIDPVPQASRRLIRVMELFSLGLLVFCLLFGAWLWRGGYAWTVRHDPSTRHTPGSIRGWAVFWIVGGIAASAFIYWTDRGMRVTTLHEVMVAGTEGLPVGRPAPVRETGFVVEHPGVEHTLRIWPQDREGRLSPRKPQAFGRVEMAVELRDDRGESVLKRQDALEAGSLTLTFTPARAGQHLLRLQPITVGIPRFHVMVTDPRKTDGKRLPGY